MGNFFCNLKIVRESKPSQMSVESRKTTMILSSIVIVILCAAHSKANFLPELDYYYIDTVGTQSTEVTPQDVQDAQTIIKDNNQLVIADILLHRDKIRRININKEIDIKDPEHPLVPSKYRVQEKGHQLIDLYFTLVNTENMILCTYLRNFFGREYTQPTISIALILTKDMGAMIEAYNEKWGSHTFKRARKSQPGIFEHMLRVWVRYNRELNEKDLQPDLIKADVDALVAEYKKGGWTGKRDQIELVLMKKSIKYAREVINGFEKANDNCLMEKIIDESIGSRIIEGPLANAYSSLVRYIKNRNQYMADILREYSHGKDCWAVWMICIAVTAPEEWIKIDECFRKADDKNISLSKFILEKVTNEEDLMFALMVSEIVDVTNKTPAKSPATSQPASTPAPLAPSPAPQPPSG